MKIVYYISWIFKKMGYAFIKLSKSIYYPKQLKRIDDWYNFDKDETIRFEYSLDENSIVFDLGGYKGQWSSDIFSRYACNVYIFEPLKKYADNIKHRFAKNHKIKVFEFGLGATDQELMISHDDDGSSMLRGEGKEKAWIHNFAEFVRKNNIETIDLIKINIEGAEFDLLDHIIENNLHLKIKNILVQFHEFVEDSNNRMKKIQDVLRKTHSLTYQVEFVWENWKLN